MPGPAVAEAVKSGSRPRPDDSQLQLHAPAHTGLRIEHRDHLGLQGKRIEVIAAGDGIETTAKLFMDIRASAGRTSSRSTAATGCRPPLTSRRGLWTR